MRVRHYSIFENNKSVIDWNDLRNSDAEPSYYIPTEKEKYLKKIHEIILPDYVEDLVRQVRQLGYKKMLSIGSGISHVEYQIKTKAGIAVVISDTTDSISRLKSFDIFDDAIKLNVMEEEIPADDSTYVLMHRIDTEFTDEGMKQVFAKCFKKQIRYIFFVPTNPSAFKIIINELKTFLVAKLKKKKRTFCGFSRDKKGLKKLWHPHYKMINEFENQGSLYILERRF